MPVVSDTRTLERFALPSASPMYARHLRRRAADYYQDDVVSVDLQRYQKRPNSTFFGFDITTQSQRRTVLVKVPYGSKELESRVPSESSPHADPPRLFPGSLVDTKGEREYAALARIHDHFAALDDPRFGTIRMLDFLPESGALIMERNRNPALRKVISKVNPFRRKHASARLQRAISNAGCWLREYHGLSAFDYTKARSTSLDEYVEVVHRFAEYLLGAGRHLGLLRSLPSKLEFAARQALPDRLSLGLSHCDYAPRNVLVDRNGRVTVFDTQSKWLVPIYEDISLFIVALKASGPQMFTWGMMHGSDGLARFEDAFLRGYFADDTVPKAAIRLFECQHLLGMWVAQVHRYRQATGMQKLVKRSRLTLWSAYISRYIRSNLLELPIQ